MKAHYGYANGSGEYYITIDTERCDGCGECLDACSRRILELITDDYDERKAAVKRQFGNTLSDVCPGYYRACLRQVPNCHSSCRAGAIEHSW